MSTSGESCLTVIAAIALTGLPLYKDTGKEAVPTYTTKLGFARINDDGQ